MSTKQKQFGVSLVAAFVVVLLAVLSLSQGKRDGLPPIGEHIVENPDGQNSPPVPLEEIKEATRYEGYSPNPKATREFLGTLRKPLFSQAAPHLFTDSTEPVLLYRSLYKAHEAKYGKPWRVGRQGIGDCVSWGWAHGADVHLAVLWDLGLSSEWHMAATEAIYGGSRCEASGRSFAGFGDGSYGAAAATWVMGKKGVGGILFRQPYDGVDLSVYSASRAKDWGAYGCGGRNDGGKLDAIAFEHPIVDVALVRTFEEAAAAIASGYPVPVCSGQGFSSRRDEQGFARASGSWSHCMCFIGVRHGERPGLLCLNSWGPDWISGPKWPDDQPDGSFWVDKSTVNSMLRGGDSFAVSGYKGFPYRKLDHGDWIGVDPPRAVAGEAHYALAP